MDKKGFFFIVVAFLLLSYILISTYVWVQAIEMEENRYSDSFRTSSMEMLLSQITDEQVNTLANISSRYAFYRLNHHSITHPVSPAVDVDSVSVLDGSELDNIRLAMRELILTGTASGDYFEDGTGIAYTEDEKRIYSISGWAGQLNASLSASGFELESLEIDENAFNFTQTGYAEFRTEFAMNLTVRDGRRGSATSIIRTYYVNDSLDATGMVDAYIARESLRQLGIEPANTIVGKKLYLAPYADEGFGALCSEDASGDMCYYVSSGDEGQGWFYGPLVLASGAGSVPASATYDYILVGTYPEIKAVPNYETFGAYILTNDPVAGGGDCPADQSATFNALDYDSGAAVPCDPSDPDIDMDTYTDRPFMVYTAFAGKSLAEISATFGGFDTVLRQDAPKLLFSARYSAEQVRDSPERKVGRVSVFDVENLRDFVMCGYYMPRNNSPSFLHRMFDLQDLFDSGTPSYPDWPASDWGIETTAAGRWAGGEIVDAEWDGYSRADIEFFSRVGDGAATGVEMIKGMPGCKSAYMAATDFDPDLDNVGHFRLSDWARWDRLDPDYDDIYWISTASDYGLTDNIGCDNSDLANCDEN